MKIFQILVNLNKLLFFFESLDEFSKITFGDNAKSVFIACTNSKEFSKNKSFKLQKSKIDIML